MYGVIRCPLREKKGLLYINIFHIHLQLCKQIGHHVNVNGISSQLASGGAYEGVVDLCLSVAAQRDPAGLALHYYKNNEPADDHQGYMAFTSRFVSICQVISSIYLFFKYSYYSYCYSTQNIDRNYYMCHSTTYIE